jgi:hypothetical protein
MCDDADARHAGDGAAARCRWISKEGGGHTRIALAGGLFWSAGARRMVPAAGVGEAMSKAARQRLLIP